MHLVANSWRIELLSLMLDPIEHDDGVRQAVLKVFCLIQAYVCAVPNIQLSQRFKVAQYLE